MNPEIKERWVTALKSGDYSQGRGKLMSTVAGENRYCCLGVLCDLAIKDGVIGQPTDYLTHKVFGIGEWDTDRADDDVSWSTLPRVVQNWAGLNYHNPTVTIPGNGGEGYSTSLASLNDDGSTFEDIARVIEEQF